MTAVLLDTHVWAWSLEGNARLSARALAAMNQADAVLISPISFFEIAQKVRLGKWPEMVPFVDRLPGLLEDQGGVVASFGAAVCVLAGMMDWAHRDPFDRLIAATARQETVLEKLLFMLTPMLSLDGGRLSPSQRSRADLTLVSG